jgi:hypothetical protein
MPIATRALTEFFTHLRLFQVSGGKSFKQYQATHTAIRFADGGSYQLSSSCIIEEEQEDEESGVYAAAE